MGPVLIEASTTEEKTIVVKEAWSTERQSGLTKRKYEGRAKWLMNSITVYRPAPASIINLSDMSTRIKEALPISSTRFAGFVATMQHNTVVDIELW